MIPVDHLSTASVGSVGDAYDNATAERFLDGFNTELISGRNWRTRSQLELAVVKYIGRFNHARLHEWFGDMPPAEFRSSLRCVVIATRTKRRRC
jgi:putative transposase